MSGLLELLRDILYELFAWLFTDQSGHRSRDPHRFRPMLEGLGERIVPSTAVFMNTDGNGLWSDVKNWSGGSGPGGMPTPQDVVLLDGKQGKGGNLTV